MTEHTPAATMTEHAPAVAAETILERRCPGFQP